MKNILGGTILLVILVLIAWQFYPYLTSMQDETIDARPEEGYPAPGFELESIAGKQLALNQFYGKPVFLIFWATP